MKLNPQTADLRTKDPRFFLRGVQLSKLCDEIEQAELRTDLKNVYAERFTTTVNSAATATDQEFSSAIRTLDMTDRLLFDAQRGACEDYKRWKGGGGGKLQAAAVIQKNNSRAKKVAGPSS